MKSYSEREIFSDVELGLLKLATRMAEAIPRDISSVTSSEIRCHELARAIGKILDLQAQDGYYGFVEHSWLWTRQRIRGEAEWSIPNVLDVYAVGSLPMVRLVDMQHTGPQHAMLYRPQADPRTDIDQVMVDRLVGEIRGAMALHYELDARPVGEMRR
jgi:hypothetical protein